MEERVQKIMASAGIASRRNCEKLIAAGRVSVNGKIIKLGDKAEAEKDSICLDSKKIKFQKKVYVALYKPVGYVTTVKEEWGRPTVLDLVKVNERIFPVGRLDMDAEGLVLLTNDGELANRIMHPRYETQKTYLAKLNRRFTSIERLKRGVVVDGRKVSVKKFKVIKATNVELTIHEGRTHIVKRLFDAMNYQVIALKRLAIGNLTLGELREGQWRFLDAKEAAELKKSAGS